VYQIVSFDIEKPTKPLYVVYILDDNINQDLSPLWCNTQCQHHYMKLKYCKIITVH